MKTTKSKTQIDDLYVQTTLALGPFHMDAKKFKRLNI